MGNIRLGYQKGNNGSAEVLEENNYYPFGLKHEGYNVLNKNPNYQYKYNGKELQIETGMYDYGARFYMPDIGRWGVVDPLAEISRAFTPYHYGNNNPIRFTDPDGRSAMDSFYDYHNYSDDNRPLLSTDSDGNMSVNSTYRQHSYLNADGAVGGGNPKPSFWQKVENFFSNLFRGKNKQADALPIAGAINRPIYVGELEKVGRALTIEQVTAALGTIIGKSVWALPLILNGDSAGAKGYDIPLTGATDVAGEISTADVNRNGVLLYRGSIFF